MSSLSQTLSVEEKCTVNETYTIQNTFSIGNESEFLIVKYCNVSILAVLYLKEILVKKVRSSFHFCCYVNMLDVAVKTDVEFPPIVINQKNCTKLFSVNTLSTHVTSFIKNNQDFSFVLLVCNKRCHNTITSLLKKEEKTP